MICPNCGELSWTLSRYGTYVHKENCPHRVDDFHQGNPPPSTTVCSKCGSWTSEGRKILAEQHKNNPIFDIDLSLPLSKLVESIRHDIVMSRGKLYDISMAFPGWGERLEDVQGLLTCGLIALYTIAEDMKKVEKDSL